MFPNTLIQIRKFLLENKAQLNIKITTTHTIDNLNCKLGIYYALTGDIPSFNNGINCDQYFCNLKTNLKENSADAYFYFKRYFNEYF